MANQGNISFGLAIGAGQSVRRNAGDTAFEAYTPAAGGGDVSKVGTPVDNQVAVWTGDGTIEGDAALTYDAATDTLTSVTFSGNLTGNVTGNVSGSSGSTTGNAATVTVADAGGDATTFPLLGTAATGSLAPATDAGLTYDATANRLGVTGGAELGTAVAGIGGDATLDVFGTTNAIFHGHNSGAQSTTGGAAIIAYAVPGAAILSGNRISAFVGGGDVDASHTLANATAVTSFATENWSGSQHGASMKFEVTANGATSRTVALTLGQDLSATFAGTVALGTNSLTLTGSIGATGARVTKVWATDLEVTNAIAGSVTGSAATLTTARNIFGNSFNGSADISNVATLGTASTTAGQLVFQNATNAFTQTFTGSALAASRNYILPTVDPTAGQVLSASAPSGADITLSWEAAGGFSWGATAAAGAGTGLAMTSDAADASTPFVTMAHTFSGTTTSATATQFSLATSRTATGGTASDNFVNALFSRTNVTNGANLTSAGSVVSITGSDTQTANTLTPTYDLLKLTPSLRSTGSSINIAVPNSVVTAPTNGHIYAVLGNTQTVAQVVQKIDLGTSAQGHTGLLVNMSNAADLVYGVHINMQSSTIGRGLKITGTGNNGTNASYISLGDSTTNTFFGSFLTVGDTTTGLMDIERRHSKALWNFSTRQASNASTVTARTASLVNFFHQDLINQTQTLTHNYSYYNIKRTSQTNSAGSNLTAQGSVLKLENVATQTAGTLTDTVNVLSVVQDTDSTGDIANFYNGATKVGAFLSTGLAVTDGTITQTVALARLDQTSSTGTNACMQSWTNTGGLYFQGVENSAGNYLGAATAYALIRYAPTGKTIEDSIAGTTINKISSTGIVVTGTISATTGMAVGGATAGAGGIAFPATAVAVADANTLDDYEEGTWTPVIQGDTGVSGQSYNAATFGKYTKIGRQVTSIFWARADTMGTPTGTYIMVSGLPFASGTGQEPNQGFISDWATGNVSWLNLTGMYGGTAGTVVYVTGRKAATAGGAFDYVPIADFGNGATVAGGVTTFI